ncbi:hypothetical protein ACLOJK_010578 [Asimina triloba]
MDGIGDLWCNKVGEDIHGGLSGGDGILDEINYGWELCLEDDGGLLRSDGVLLRGKE